MIREKGMSWSLPQAEEKHPVSLPRRHQRARAAWSPCCSQNSQDNGPGKDPCGVSWGDPALLQAPGDLSQVDIGLSEAESLTCQQFRFQGLEIPHVNVQD